MKGIFKKTVAIVAVSAVTAMTAMFTGCSFVDKVKEEIDHHFGDKGGAETVCVHVDENLDNLCELCEKLADAPETYLSKIVNGEIETTSTDYNNFPCSLGIVIGKVLRIDNTTGKDSVFCVSNFNGSISCGSISVDTSVPCVDFTNYDANPNVVVMKDDTYTYIYFYDDFSLTWESSGTTYTELFSTGEWGMSNSVGLAFLVPVI